MAQQKKVIDQNYFLPSQQPVRISVWNLTPPLLVISESYQLLVVTITNNFTLNNVCNAKLPLTDVGGFAQWKKYQKKTLLLFDNHSWSTFTKKQKSIGFLSTVFKQMWTTWQNADTGFTNMQKLQMKHTVNLINKAENIPEQPELLHGIRKWTHN